MACSAPVVGGAQPPTSTLTGEVSTTDIAALAVDWNAELRGALAAAMHGSLAVVRVEDASVHVLSDCHLAGSYQFVAIPSKPGVVRIRSSEELVASAVLARPRAVELGGHVLDLAIATTGEWATIRKRADRSELVGDCAGATHFVRRVAVGASVSRVVDGTRVSDPSELLGASASACGLAKRDDGVPPASCDAPVRVELRVLGAAEPSVLDSAQPLATASLCPEGFSFQAGRCAISEWPACDSSRPLECQTGCAAGDVTSCAVLGSAYSRGAGVARDLGRARAIAEAQCTRGVERQCVELGLYYRDGGGGARDVHRAAALFEHACDAGLAIGCYGIGGLYDYEVAMPIDFARAMRFYKLGCDAGYAPACTNIAAAFHDGRGVAKDEAAAATMFERACDGGDAYACKDLSEALFTGTGVAKDEARASSVAASACDAGIGVACLGLGTRFSLGDGVPKDVSRATALFARARADLAAECEDNGSRCESLGEMLLYGWGAPPDPTQAAEAFRTGCEDRGTQSACRQLADSLVFARGIARDEAKAAALYERACSFGDAAACRGSGVLLSEGRGVTADLPRAFARFRSACESGSSEGCSNLADSYEKGRGVARDLAKAFDARSRSCTTLYSPLGCYYLAKAYELGIGTAVDLVRAAEHYEKACDGEFDRHDQAQASGCQRLGQLFEAGKGVAKNDERADGLLARACELRQGAACVELAQRVAQGIGEPKSDSRAVELRARACELGTQSACKH